MIALALLTLGILAISSKGHRVKEDDQTTRLRAMIRDFASLHGVDPTLALTFARLESNFDPTREGDLKWHENVARYNAVVPHDSPYFDRPERWHSYGLFQLLAPYHVFPGEDPRVLLDPAINTIRAMKTLRNLGIVNDHNPEKMRLAYTGATRLSPEKQAQILARFRRAYAQEAALWQG